MHALMWVFGIVFWFIVMAASIRSAYNWGYCDAMDERDDYCHEECPECYAKEHHEEN